jgi:hypothetical protein
MEYQNVKRFCPSLENRDQKIIGVKIKQLLQNWSFKKIIPKTSLSPSFSFFLKLVINKLMKSVLVAEHNSKEKMSFRSDRYTH